MKRVLRRWFITQVTDSYQQGIEKHVLQYHECLSRSGNYAENITTEVQSKAKVLIRDGSICIAHLLWLTSVCCSEDAGAFFTCVKRLCK
jgi:hypothetical protein